MRQGRQWVCMAWEMWWPSGTWTTMLVKMGQVDMDMEQKTTR